MRRHGITIAPSFFILAGMLTFSSCDLIRMKKDAAEEAVERKPVARVNNVYLYQDELTGIVQPNTTKEDSATRINTYVQGWIKKQLLISEAMNTISINEAEIERKMLDYRYSLIGYEYQNFYIQNNLNDSVSNQEIEEYYKGHLDNFILKQNIIQGAYIKVPKQAPRTKRVKDLLFSTKPKDVDELKSYCISFSDAFHLPDSSWMEFDKLVVNSPLAEIPNKIQFLRSYPYYETSDNDYLYFLKINAYKITDNISPLEFVRADIRNIILNRRKVELVKKLEDQVYDNAVKQKEFEIFNQ